MDCISSYNVIIKIVRQEIQHRPLCVDDVLSHDFVHQSDDWEDSVTFCRLFLLASHWTNSSFEGRGLPRPGGGGKRSKVSPKEPERFSLFVAADYCVSGRGMWGRDVGEARASLEDPNDSWACGTDSVANFDLRPSHYDLQSFHYLRYCYARDLGCHDDCYRTGPVYILRAVCPYLEYSWPTSCCGRGLDLLPVLPYMEFPQDLVSFVVLAYYSHTTSRRNSTASFSGGGLFDL